MFGRRLKAHWMYHVNTTVPTTMFGGGGAHQICRLPSSDVFALANIGYASEMSFGAGYKDEERQRHTHTTANV